METQQSVVERVYSEYFTSSNLHGMLRNYTEKCDEYEQEFSTNGYTSPPDVAREGMRLLPRGNTPETRVLDFACGTGLVADAMVTRGFRGEIHGLDGSAGMLGVARRKGIYRSLQEKVVVPGTRLDYDDCWFDGVFNCGGFGDDQLHPAVMPELARVVRRGGAVVMTCRHNDPPMEFQRRFDDQVRALEEAGVWREGRMVKTLYFNCDFYNQDQPLYANIYCYIKN